MNTVKRLLVGAVALGMAGCSGGEAADERPRQIDDPLQLPTPADALEAEIQRRAPTEAMLMIPADAVVRGELAEGERREFTSVMRTGLCYKILGQAGAGVRDLDLFVYDPAGSLLQRDATVDDHPVIGVQRAICPPESGAYRVEARAMQGGGPFAVQVWVSQ